MNEGAGTNMIFFWTSMCPVTRKVLSTAQLLALPVSRTSVLSGRTLGRTPLGFSLVSSDVFCRFFVVNLVAPLRFDTVILMPICSCVGSSFARLAGCPTSISAWARFWWPWVVQLHIEWQVNGANLGVKP
jgi:hypothetical protein